MSRYCLPLLLAGMVVFPARAQELSAQEVFKKVSPSVVVIEVFDDSLEAFKKDPSFKTVASGSGVVIQDRDDAYDMVATNCHLVDRLPSAGVRVLKGNLAGVGNIYGRNADMDLCLIKVAIKDWSRVERGGKAIRIKLPAVRIASSQWLEVGDPVYAIGAPQGLELTLSNGLVSGIREYKGTEYIQTTAPISQGSSGGGLFDAQGRLVGITTMYMKDGQNLNFAIPAELIASVPISSSAADAAADASAAVAAAEKPSTPRDRWLLIDSNDKQETYIDTQTVKRNGTDVTIWVKHQRAKPTNSVLGGVYDEASSLYTVHCGSRQYTQRHYSQRLRGASVYSRDYKSYELEKENVTPDTVGEAVYERACGL